VVRFFRDATNRRVLHRLEDAGVRAEPLRRRLQRRLEGKTFVFTGRLEGLSRAEAERAVEAAGGRATSSVSGETDYLVVGESPGSKLDEARERGVRLLDEAEFEALIGR
jgi:DNA ligase (NAD+)